MRIEPDVTVDDDLIGLMITAAREHVEVQTGRQLITSEIVEVFDSFPPGAANTHGGRLHLQRVPVQSVESVGYLEKGVLATWDSGEYRVDTIFEPAAIVPVYGESWPVPDKTAGAVRVTYTAGYSTAADVPSDLKQQILKIVSEMYEYREPRVSEKRTNVDLALERWRVKTF